MNVWSDGSSTGRVGPGGLAAVVEDGRRAKRLFVSLGFPHSVTNNQMELLAAYAGLRAVTRPERCHSVTVHSDSQYVVLGYSRLAQWEARRWRKVKNVVLWEALHRAAARVESQLPHAGRFGFEWIRGHDGIEYNEEADRLAVLARTQATQSGAVTATATSLHERPLPQLDPMPPGELLGYIPLALRAARSARRNVATGRY